VTCSQALPWTSKATAQNFRHSAVGFRRDTSLYQRLPPQLVGMLLAVMSKKRTVNLLDLDDHLLCEVFKSLSVHDKQQNVQRTCLRFRSALQRPSIVEAWGSISVTPPGDIEARRRIGRLVTWILERKLGERHGLAVDCQCMSS
jgi:hypothetical protein